MFTRPIVIGLSPNTQGSDYKAAAKLLWQPWHWRDGSAIGEVETWFKDYFQTQLALSFNAGRSALLAILESLNLPKGSEILVQAFTCVAVPNSVTWAGHVPIFVDVDKTLNLNVQDAEKKLSPKTKVLIVQHTFGVPADMDKIVTFCQTKNLFLIEDCAHALGATYKGKRVGTFGNAAFFSFGRDKIVSSVFGGIALFHQKSAPLAGNSQSTIQQKRKKNGIAKLDEVSADLNQTRLRHYHKQLSFPTRSWILRQLMHPLVCAIVLPLYNIFGIGKGVLWFAQKLKLVSLPVYGEEKRGRKPKDFPQRFPNALAVLALVQLKKQENMNARRRHIASYYASAFENANFTLPSKKEGSIYLRYNLMTNRAQELWSRAKKTGVILGSWYHHVIDPRGVLLQKVGYTLGSCPKAEKAAQESLNLPTYPTLTDKQIHQICHQLISKYGN